MRCRVLLFAGLADLAGAREVELDLPAAAIVNDALHAVALMHPRLTPLLAAAAVALDEKYVSRDAALTDGCTLAVIPPVSGG